jgi:hypothetical protein
MNAGSISVKSIRKWMGTIARFWRQWRGRRFQDSVRPDVFLYYRDYGDLPQGNTTIVVVVRFGFAADGSENNFIVTAYQIFRKSR